MTTERAIELLHRLQDEQFDGIHGDERREALEMAVRALSGDGDTISRQQAIDAVVRAMIDGADAELVEGVMELLPSAQPETHDKRTETHACDLISREQAIDAVDVKCLHRGIVKGIQGIIEDLPSAQPQWIPCSERLPGKRKGNEDTEYLVTIDNGEFKYVTSDYWINWFGNWRWNDSEAIAWMPLPKPYGGESE